MRAVRSFFVVVAAVALGVWVAPFIPFALLVSLLALAFCVAVLLVRGSWFRLRQAGARWVAYMDREG